MKIMRSEGPMGLYMGLVPTIAKQATNQAVRFPVQFYAKQILTGGDKKLDSNPIYKGTVDCAMQILKKEGPMFFYSGTWPRLIRVSLDVGITFAIFPIMGKFISFPY